MSQFSVLVSHYGSTAIFLLMALESCCIPIPSEAVMPFAGYLAYVHTLSFWPVVLIGTVANVCGGLIAYLIGYYAGRPFILRVGRYIMLNQRHLEKSETWFRRYGDLTVLFGRMVPAIRTFVSLPAGIAKMSIGRFVLFSAIGSFIWNLGLTYAGFQLHAQWHIIGAKLKPFTYVGALILVVAVIWFWFSRKKNV